jgi:exosortase/archaeosortase
MDMTDIDKEIANLKLPTATPAKRVDLTVKHASLKVIVSKALAILFFLAIVLFDMYTVTNAKNVDVDSTLVMVMGIVYLVVGGYAALKLWNIEFIGWLALFYISLAGIALPAISAYSRGIASGTIPIIAVSLVTLAVLWLIRDLYMVKKIGDIFRMPR